ncbi:MAG: extracellular solute-binding protein [Anaerolineae bacterium]|nr:extracellular solute-binding protein [Anaerolineae bacterium]
MNTKKMFGLSVLLVALALLVAACSAPAPAPTTAPAVATSAPAATSAPEPTTAPAATNAPEPTTAPAAAAAAIKLWHGQTGAEADALGEVIKKFQDANPGTTVEILAVPFDQLKNKFTTEASTGGGPDLLIGPKDWIGELAQADLIASLDDKSEAVGLNNLNPSAVDANKFQGKVWAFPESTEAMALWLNTDKVKTPPTSADELLKLAEESGVAINQGFYQSMGILSAYGAKLFDENQKCILDQGGTTDALDWLTKAKATKGVIMDSDGGKLDAAFKDGQVAAIFNGPWATGDYAKALGADKIAIAAPIAMGPGKFAPFLGTKNVFLSANSAGDNQAAALKFLNFLSQPDTQALFVPVGHIPSNPNVKIDDPIIAGFLAQTQTSTYFPNEPEMGAVWTPGADMITTVLEGKSSAQDAAVAACKTINEANKK